MKNKPDYADLFTAITWMALAITCGSQNMTASAILLAFCSGMRWSLFLSKLLKY